MTNQDIQTSVAQVNALGTAQNATVNFSGALMEMLATTYSHILMAAVRESIQNACDAARRSGYSFEEGVHITLPTEDNPMFVITDKGAGMSNEFMFDTYLSFGSSTKSGDDGAVGGLGVGRWAAYGYIRECLISTTTAEDMVERTYFQFQSEDNMPQVQLAGEGPGSHVGTSISFPVRESDLPELYKAVSWLKGIMQITMSDSFTVDKPDLLPSDTLPEHSETILELGDFDESLAGVVVHPMMGSDLQYERGSRSMRSGSLIVMVNKDAEIGGLPFHVTSESVASVFSRGCIVEIPMNFSVPFMPSREEVKYTDELEALLKKIDNAVKLAVISRIEDLYSKPCLESKTLLTKLLGRGRDNFNWFTFSNGYRGELAELISNAVGSRNGWRGRLPVRMTSAAKAIEASFRYVLEGKSLRAMEIKDDELYLCQNGGRHSIRFEFNTLHPLTLVYNDLKAGGISRFRNWMKERGQDVLKKEEHIFIEATDYTQAEVVAKELSSVYDNEFILLPVSSMPEIARRVVAGGVSRTVRGSRLTVFCNRYQKQETIEASFTGVTSESRKFWVTKKGAEVFGFKYPLTEMVHTYSNTDLTGVLSALKVDKLYLLTPNQAENLQKMLAEANANGYLDMEFEEFEAMEDGIALYNEIHALKGWVPFQQGIKELIDSDEVQEVIAGKKPFNIRNSYSLNSLCRYLAESPRLMLSGTKFDAAISPYVDVTSGEQFLLEPYEASSTPTAKLCQALIYVCRSLDETFDEVHSQIAESIKLMEEAGSLDYQEAFENLGKQFPLLHQISLTNSEGGIDDICHALALVYR